MACSARGKLSESGPNLHRVNKKRTGRCTPSLYLDPHQNLFPHGRPGEDSVCFINKAELETCSCALLPLRPNSPWGRSHKLGDGALGTPGAQDQEQVIFSLMKVTSSVFLRRHQLFAVLQRALGSKSCRAQPSFPWIRPAGRHMHEDASCKKHAHRFRTVGMLCTAKSGSEESLPTVALCTHDRRPVVPAAQKLGHADDVG